MSAIAAYKRPRWYEVTFTAVVPFLIGQSLTAPPTASFSSARRQTSARGSGPSTRCC